MHFVASLGIFWQVCCGRWLITWGGRWRFGGVQCITLYFGQFYYQSLNAKGEPAFDEHGIPLLDCNRGTNDTENAHKQIVTTFGTR
jgi:hypothetical protein